ncbi:fish-egg lectin-like [Salvelinus sp. IW2-2015]|uniref:fish-egg lectin-like n=1 Tax=Salvelinus sp. IW2-2015 TaxID=2691554 RepID=UPI0038D36C95
MPGLGIITVGPAGIWGVNKADSIYKYGPVTGCKLPLDAGGAQFIVGANMDDTPFCLTRSATVGYKGPGSPPSRTGLPGAVKYYSVDLWVLGRQNKGWSHIDGKLSMIEVATDGSVFGVNYAGSVFTRDGITASKPEGTGWSNITMYMPMKHETYDLGRLWVVSKSGVTMVCTP